VNMMNVIHLEPPPKNRDWQLRDQRCPAPSEFGAGNLTGGQSELSSVVTRGGQLQFRDERLRVLNGPVDVRFRVFNVPSAQSRTSFA